ncbi:MAG: YjjG family noncanonical pyrimidine nucleotidase [Anaerolineae bacterium]|jgi:2-haloacid dehalogenase|nr:YjjG family noncanonical pyrimidine nucleotidase [Anaerolineae bacterium]
MRYTWVLFDADDTLFDYGKAEAAALRKTFEVAGLGFEAPYLEVYHTINQRLWQDFELGKIPREVLRTRRFALLFEAIGVATDPVRFAEAYVQYLAEGGDLMVGAAETVAALYGKVGLVLITNGLTLVQRSRLARSEIAPYFTDVVISEEVDAMKPDRAIFDAAFARMGHPEKAEVLIVGDSLTSDIKGGSDYGIDTCWFNPAGSPCDPDVRISYEIAALRDVLPIVGLSWS